MTIVSRYILREMVIPLAYCLIGFIMIFVIFDLFDHLKHILAGGMSAWQIALYYLAYVSAYLEWITPAALMLAVLYTMWRFSHNGEIIAMRASGIGFGRIAAPMFGVSVFMALLIAAVNEFVVPTAGAWAKNVSSNRFQPVRAVVHESVPFMNYAERRIWMIDRIDPNTPHQLDGVRITFEREDRTRELEIVAVAAQHLDGAWWLVEPRFTDFDAEDRPVPSRFRASDKRPLVRVDGLSERPSDFLNEFKEWQYLSFREIRRYLRLHPAMGEQAAAEKSFLVHHRLASPWAAVVITLFAIPAGVASGRQSVSRGVLLSIGLFFGFFALSHLCQFLGQRGMIPAWLGAWTPNAVFLATGIGLYQRQR